MNFLVNRVSLKLMGLALLLFALPWASAESSSDADGERQYILFNLDGSWPQMIAAFEEYRSQFSHTEPAKRRTGVGVILSYLHSPRDVIRQRLEQILAMAHESNTPIFLQLDGEQWWQFRSDLWNWWDPSQPGYDPDNAVNVEWTGWSPDFAIRIAWRNWGRQLRVLPPPNLMSPAYRKACHDEMAWMVPRIVQWWKALPRGQRDLLVGVKLGWESSIGVNAWYYPDGNQLAGKPEIDDPTTGLQTDILPSRGVQTIGYAAVSTAGLNNTETITESQITEVVRRHLHDLSNQTRQLGLPREKIFTHGVGWKEGESLYDAAVNPYACPGWSFYRYAADPGKDIGVQRALARSDARYWGAVEWLYLGDKTTADWLNALQTTLDQPRCRLLCIYNWRSVSGNPSAMEAITQTVRDSIPKQP
jgi:hypothetical protein